MFQKGFIALTLLVCPLMASAQFLLWDDFLEQLTAELDVEGEEVVDCWQVTSRGKAQ
jgi:hypothetical protein